jgi:ketosteroid isomerase-like protein
MASRSVIEESRAAAREGDVGGLAALFAEDIRVFGSVNFKPFEGKAAATMIFGMLLEVCSDVDFVSEHMSQDGVALLVRGRIKDRQFEGAQFLTFDENGKITEFRDFVRPLSALLALQEAAGEYMAGQSAAPVS